jgi:aminopeptidase N
MKTRLLALLTVVVCFAQAQTPYNPLSTPNTYRQADNPNYWKNKMPHAAYWQQDVHYTIKANIDETKDRINASEKLVYWNNSPDDLNELYFHLYQNAFQPESYCAELHEQNNGDPYYGRYERKKLGTVVKNLTIDGKSVETELDNTILKVFLNEPLKSGESITIEMDFNTYFDNGSLRRRMKTFNAFGNSHYDGVLWYPRIAVYDHKFGWTTDQHLGKEFYGDFGTWDVELTFASNYVVEATGALQNRAEVLPDDLRAKLDVKNFADKEWNSTPSIITPYDSLSRKTWVYHAENVHDFAFTADPTYRIGEAEWNGIRAISMVQEPHASKWQNAADYAARCIEVFSEDIGMYTYHKIIVADARDGMEYPMITLDGGKDPSYRGLLAHEIGHQWFYGQVGSNETYRAAMDEGFTQFLTAWALNKIDGEFLVSSPMGSAWKDKFKKPVKALDSRVYFSYLRDATKFNDPQLNTHSDDFGSALGHGGGYRHVYYKTATMLYNLQYVLGDELFLNAMKHYFSQWKIAHPYLEDFRASIINYTKVDLNWFFDQWLETTKTIDYSVENIQHNGGDEYKITFARKGAMQMPIDFSVYAQDGTEHKFHIPNHWFVKETDAKVLDKWHAWGKLYPTHSVTVNIPSGIKNVDIDPSRRLADRYMLDNSKSMPMDVAFDAKVWNLPNWQAYDLKLRPDVWWNAYDGVKAGAHFNGHYMLHHHIMNGNVWLNTGFLQDSSISSPEGYNDFSYRFNYRTGLDKFSKHTTFKLHSSFLDGLSSQELGLEKYDYKKENRFYAAFKSMHRADATDLNYLLYQGWESGKRNNIARFGWSHYYRYKGGKGEVTFELNSSTIGSDYDYAKISMTSINRRKLGPFNVNTRFFAQYGSGAEWASESELYLAGANPEELMNNKFTRSQGFIPTDYSGYGNTTNNFQMGGGLNLRGYAGYLAPELNEQGVYNELYKGQSGASISAEVEFHKLLPIIKEQNKFVTYLFADAGVINHTAVDYSNFKEAFSSLRTDAGVGVALTVDRWGPLETAKPITIRVDFPMFLNKYPNVDESYLQTNRFVFGIGRSF